jgi:hypothetical protein
VEYNPSLLLFVVWLLFGPHLYLYRLRTETMKIPALDHRQYWK